MLDKLYKKLNLIAVSFTMLIITMVMAIIGFNYISTEKGNQSSFFQRMATLLIYQLEEHPRDYEELMEEYEDRYEIAGVLKDESGRYYIRAMPLLWPMQTSSWQICRSRRLCRRRQIKKDSVRHSREASMKFKENSMKSIGEYLHRSIPKKAVSISYLLFTDRKARWK